MPESFNVLVKEIRSLGINIELSQDQISRVRKRVAYTDNLLLTGDADFEVIIGKHNEIFLDKKEEDYYEDDIDDRSINEMCTVYGEIFYEMKKVVDATSMPFLEKRADWYVMQDFFTYMDYCYGN